MGRGFGVGATVGAEVIAEVAGEAERLGYTSFWVNDVPGSDGLAALGEAAKVTSSIRLAVGVLGLGRRDPGWVAGEVERLRLPVERLWLGVGAGGSARPLEAVRAGVERLRSLAPAPIFVAATGPRMRRLAGEIAAGVLFNWPVPASVREAAHVVGEAAAAAGRPRPVLAAYIRCALPAAGARVEAELAHYGGHYGAQLARFGATERDAFLTGSDAAAFQSGLASFEPILDEPVVRAITPDDSAADLLELLRLCAPTESSRRRHVGRA